MNATAVNGPGLPWWRARMAYALLVDPDDPAARQIADGAVDLRPGWSIEEGDHLLGGAGIAVVSGPDDLIELRRIVERMTGPGTWPAPRVPDGFEVVGSRSCVVGLPRPAAALAVIMAMDGLMTDRSGAWRTWKTLVESIGSGLEAGFELTFEAQIVYGG